MGSLIKRSLSGSIHRIREFELEKVNLADEFDILQIVGEGWFGKILLVEHKATDTEMVVKALPKPYTALKDFYREFHYGLHLGVNKSVITTYDVAFETAGFYVFSQEYAPLGDLTSNVSETGIGELHTKRVAKQLSSALEHLHTRDLVHRDIKLDNILVFKSDFSRIKLCDFGETRHTGSVVIRRNEWLPYAPPEVLQISTDGNYVAHTSHDVWQFGIVIFVCLTGCLPWQKASSEDPRYCRYLSWQTSTMPLKRQPKLFKLVSSKAQRLFKKYLEPKPEKRPHGLAEIHRFFEDRWLSKGGMEKYNEVPMEEEGLCPSMYSFHSSPEEKDKLLHSLKQYGLETTVDRVAKKDRIRDWIQASVIEEEDEEADYINDDEIGVRDNQTGPMGERVMSRGPISEKKINGTTVVDSNKKTRKERSLSVLSLRKEPDVYTPPVDPRIPLEQQKHKISVGKQVDHNKGGVSQGDNESLPVVCSSVENDRKMPYSNNINNNSISKNNNKLFNIQSVLPFQNVKLLSSAPSSDSAHSSDSNNTMKHKINIQLPQSDRYAPRENPQEKEKGSSIGSGNGNYANNYIPNTPPVNRRQVYEDKRTRSYGATGHKGSSNKKSSIERSPTK